jgi:hypothetical protein
LAESPALSSRHLFPSLHQLDLARRNLEPITSEVDLSSYERDVVENPVRQLIEAVYNDKKLRKVLGMKGPVSFESHTNLGVSIMDGSVEEAIAQMSISEPAEKGVDEKMLTGKGKRMTMIIMAAEVRIEGKAGARGRVKIRERAKAQCQLVALRGQEGRGTGLTGSAFTAKLVVQQCPLRVSSRRPRTS